MDSLRGRLVRGVVAIAWGALLSFMVPQLTGLGSWSVMLQLPLSAALAGITGYLAYRLVRNGPDFVVIVACFYVGVVSGYVVVSDAIAAAALGPAVAIQATSLADILDAAAVPYSLLPLESLALVGGGLLALNLGKQHRHPLHSGIGDRDSPS